MYPGAAIRIAGLGHSLPRWEVPNTYIEERCGLAAGWIERNTGVHARRWVREETQPQLAAGAAREALQDSGIDVSELDLIVNASATRHQAIPDGAHLLQRELGEAAAGIPCVTVKATCLSFLVALDLAACLITAGRCRRILIVSAEVPSRGINFSIPASAALLGDAAAAAVVTGADQLDESRLEGARFESLGSAVSLAQVTGGGSGLGLEPGGASAEDSQFRVDGMGFALLVARHLPGMLERFWAGLGIEIDGYDRIIPHQSSRHAVKAVRRALGVPAASVATSYEALGNCIAASIPSTLYQESRAGRLRRGDRVLLVGAGAGVCFGALLLTF